VAKHQLLGTDGGQGRLDRGHPRPSASHVEVELVEILFPGSANRRLAAIEVVTHEFDVDVHALHDCRHAASEVIHYQDQIREFLEHPARQTRRVSAQMMYSSHGEPQRVRGFEKLQIESELDVDVNGDAQFRAFS